MSCFVPDFHVRSGVSAQVLWSIAGGLPRRRLLPPLAAPPGRSSSLRCGRSTWTDNTGQTPVGTARLIANYDVAQFFAGNWIGLGIGL
jgi:hypothetical protein